MQGIQPFIYNNVGWLCPHSHQVGQTRIDSASTLPANDKTQKTQAIIGPLSGLLWFAISATYRYYSNYFFVALAPPEQRQQEFWWNVVPSVFWSFFSVDLVYSCIIADVL